MEQFEVVLVDHSRVGEMFPVDDLVPVLLAENHDGHTVAVFLGLDKGQQFEHFVEGAESAGEHHEGSSHLHEPVLTDKEVAELQVQFVVDVGVRVLFERKLDVEAGGGCAHIVCAAVARFHDTGTATGHNGETLVLLVGPATELGAQLTGGVIVFGNGFELLESF